MQPLWIDSNAAFAQFCLELPEAVPVALDTEFLWTRTYVPVFALLQMGLSRERCAIVDPLKITEWTPLRELLCDSRRPKIFFSGSNDLPILVRACGGYEHCVPSNLFDVQLSAAFAGGAPGQSLKKVIAGELGIELSKSETRSDWTIRPLTAEQLDYACDDVVMLPEIARRHSEKMAAMGTLDFFREEMDGFGAPALYALPPVENAWRSFGGYWRIRSPQERAIVRSLLVWRENCARKHNLARNFIFKDDGLRWMLQNHPRTIHDLLRMPFAKRSAIQAFGQDILKRLTEPDDIEETPSEARDIRCEAYDRYCSRIAGCVRKFAERYGIDPSLVAVNRDIGALAARLVQHQPTDGLRLTTGWRKAVMTPMQEMEQE